MLNGVAWIVNTLYAPNARSDGASQKRHESSSGECLIVVMLANGQCVQGDVAKLSVHAGLSTRTRKSRNGIAISAGPKNQQGVEKLRISGLRLESSDDGRTSL